jgi:hypothetical protein
MSRSTAANYRFQLTPPSVLEHDLQIDCTKMLWRVLLPDVCWTAVDHAHSLNMTIGRNGRPIGLLEAQKRVARGIKPGIADYLFWHESRGFAIELKRDVDADLSDDQDDFLRQMILAKVEVSVAWTIWQVFNKVKAWGLCRNVTVMT